MKFTGREPWLWSDDCGGLTPQMFAAPLRALFYKRPKVLLLRKLTLPFNSPYYLNLNQNTQLNWYISKFSYLLHLALSLKLKISAMS